MKDFYKALESRLPRNHYVFALLIVVVIIPLLTGCAWQLGVGGQEGEGDWPLSSVGAQSDSTGVPTLGCCLTW